jgi:hypothetical protein
MSVEDSGPAIRSTNAWLRRLLMVAHGAPLDVEIGGLSVT